MSRPLRNTKSAKKSPYYRGLLIIFTVLLLWIQYQLWFSHNNVFHLLSVHKNIAEQKSMNEERQQRNQVLIDEVQDLKQGHDAIETIARRQLGLIKPHETFYQVI